MTCSLFLQYDEGVGLWREGIGWPGEEVSVFPVVDECWMGASLGCVWCSNGMMAGGPPSWVVCNKYASFGPPGIVSSLISFSTSLNIKVTLRLVG